MSVQKLPIKPRRKPLTVFDIALYTICVIISIVFLYPIYYVFVAAFSKPSDFFSNPLIILPRTFSLYNMEMMLKSAGIWIGYRNTLFYMAIGTVINICLTVTLAYALAQREMPIRRTLNFMIVFTMYFSGGLIPTFLVVRNLGILNTIWAIMLPGAISTWNLMVTRTYLSTQISSELLEAAEVDGAGEYCVFFHIVLPLCKPILITIGMFYASGHWNSWFSSLIYLRDRSLYPLQVFLRELLILNDAASMTVEAGDYASNMAMYILTMKYAVMVATLLPMLIVFPFVQKYFVKGIMIGALKG